MKIGFIGLGKLGLPVALAIESKGHQVIGTDINDITLRNIRFKTLNYMEKGAEELLAKSNIEIKNLNKIVKESDIIFVPIQTPHDKKYEGVTRLPEEKADFNYDYLVKGIKDLNEEIEQQGKDKTVIIISTVLPGTISRLIKPILGSHLKLCYNPYFIAMGTTIDDFLNAEINLFGVDDENAAQIAEQFYKTVNKAPFFKTTIENAELIKVAYNTFISTKISMINTIMETCHHLPNTNVDDITEALSLCTTRIISKKYLYGGMGDGGGCHPRDNIALRYMAEKLDLGYDLFDSIMLAREIQAKNMANKLIQLSKENNLPVVILGESYKPGVSLKDGSPSILVGYYVEQSLGKVEYDTEPKQAVYLLGHMGKHHDYNFTEGSIVVDPWRSFTTDKKINIIHYGNTRY